MNSNDCENMGKMAILHKATKIQIIFVILKKEPKFITNEQKGFLKGRYIGENIRLFYYTLLCTNKYQVSGLLLMADFEKAFSSST